MQHSTMLSLALLSATVVACGPGSAIDTTATTTDPTSATEPSGTTMGASGDTTSTDPTTGGPNPSTTDVSATIVPTTDASTTGASTTDASTTDVSTTGGSTGDASTSDTGGEAGYKFMTLAFDDYVQNDRHGAVEAGTAGIRAFEGLGFLPNSDISLRDVYNQSDPVEDANGMWLPEIADSIMFFHASLDDDLVALGLVPATFDETLMQAGPVLIPDTIKYDPKMPTGYPNGRALTDQVVDLTLAAVLIKIGGNQPLTLFADVPLNPPENDVPFAAEFPYLAPPHVP